MEATGACASFAEDVDKDIDWTNDSENPDQSITTRSTRDASTLNIEYQWTIEAVNDPLALCGRLDEYAVVIGFSTEAIGLDRGRFGRLLRVVMLPDPSGDASLWVGVTAGEPNRDEKIKYNSRDDV